MYSSSKLADMSVKNDMNGGKNKLAFLYANMLESTQSCDSLVI